jgi:hypothetical protein
MDAFTVEERRRIAEAAAGPGPIRCPVCGIELSVNDVPPSRQVSYVRHRLWVICPGCHRSAAVDAPGGAGHPG